MRGNSGARLRRALKQMPNGIDNFTIKIGKSNSDSANLRNEAFRDHVPSNVRSTKVSSYKPEVVRRNNQTGQAFLLV